MKTAEKAMTIEEQLVKAGAKYCALMGQGDGRESVVMKVFKTKAGALKYDAMMNKRENMEFLYQGYGWIGLGQGKKDHRVLDTNFIRIWAD